MSRQDEQTEHQLTKQQRYRQKNKNLINARKRVKYEQHKNEINAKQRAHYAEHKMQIIAQRRARHDQTKDLTNEKRRAKHAKNNENLNSQRRKRYAQNKKQINEERRTKHAEHSQSINEKRRQKYDDEKEAINKKRRDRYAEKKHQMTRSKAKSKRKTKVKIIDEYVEDGICPGCAMITDSVCSYCKREMICGQCSLNIVVSDADVLCSLPWQKLKSFAHKIWTTNKVFVCYNCWCIMKTKANLKKLNLQQIKNEFTQRNVAFTACGQTYRMCDVLYARKELQDLNLNRATMKLWI